MAVPTSSYMRAGAIPGQSSPSSSREILTPTDAAVLPVLRRGTVDRPSARGSTFRYVPVREAYSLDHYEVTVSRRATSFVWRMLVPLTLLVLVAGTAFRFEPTNPQPQ